MSATALFYYLFFTVHFLAAALLIGVILIQGGKGASMSASFTGGGASAFGARTDEVMVKATAWCAGIFIVTSILLTFLSERATSEVQQASTAAFETVQGGDLVAAPPQAAPETPGAGEAGEAPATPPAGTP